MRVVVEGVCTYERVWPTFPVTPLQTPMARRLVLTLTQSASGGGREIGLNVVPAVAAATESI